MMPIFKETHTYYNTPTGNVQIYICTKSKRHIKKEKGLLCQKLLGLGLLIIGFVGCLIIPEDAGGFLIAGFLGGCRFFSSYMG